MGKNGRKRKYDTLRRKFNEIISKVRSTLYAFRFITPAMFSYEDGKVCASKEAYSLCDETEKVYISLPEQVEVFKAAKEVVKALDNLHSLASRYNCTGLGGNVIGNRGVLNIEGNSGRINPYVVVECHPNGIWVRK